MFGLGIGFSTTMGSQMRVLPSRNPCAWSRFFCTHLSWVARGAWVGFCGHGGVWQCGHLVQGLLVWLVRWGHESVRVSLGSIMYGGLFCSLELLGGLLGPTICFLLSGGFWVHWRESLGKAIFLIGSGAAELVGFPVGDEDFLVDGLGVAMDSHGVHEVTGISFHSSYTSLFLGGMEALYIPSSCAGGDFLFFSQEVCRCGCSFGP